MSVMMVGCATTSKTVYEEETIQLIGEWTIGFTFQSGEVEKTLKEGKVDSLSITRTGRNPKDLELKDEIFYRLKDKHSINLNKASSDKAGRILLHPIYFTKGYTGNFQSCTVTIVDAQDNTLARLKVKNGDRNATFKDDDAFARYLADSIAKSITKKP